MKQYIEDIYFYIIMSCCFIMWTVYGQNNMRRLINKMSSEDGRNKKKEKNNG